MKKLPFFLALLFLAVGVNAQKKQLPPAVSDSFSNRYPDASEINFSKRKDVYKIKFSNEGIKTTTFYDENGIWKNAESLYINEQIPEKVQKTVAKKYPKGSFKSALLIETIEGEFFYKVTVDTEKITYFLELDKDGKITKTDQSEKSGSDSDRSYNTSGDGNDDGGGNDE